jgi:hypothetical protein
MLYKTYNTATFTPDVLHSVSMLAFKTSASIGQSEKLCVIRNSGTIF